MTFITVISYCTYNSVKSLQPEKASSGMDFILLNDMTLEKKGKKFSCLIKICDFCCDAINVNSLKRDPKKNPGLNHSNMKCFRFLFKVRSIAARTPLRLIRI